MITFRPPCSSPGRLGFALLAAVGLAVPLGAETRLGASRKVITPARGTPMAGYYHERGADGVADDLYAKLEHVIAPLFYLRPLAFYGSEKMGVSPKGAKTHVAIAAWPWGASVGRQRLDRLLRGGKIGRGDADLGKILLPALVEVRRAAEHVERRGIGRGRCAGGPESARCSRIATVMILAG